MTPYSLDPIDSRILSELSIDCRQDQSALAKKLKISRERVKYRIAKLKRDGIIERFAIKINSFKMGLGVYKTYFRLDHNKEKIEKLLTYLQRHPRTFWVAECYGHWDLIHAIYVRDPHEYQEIQEDILTRFHEMIQSYDMFIVTEGRYFSRGHLSGQNVNTLSHGGPLEHNDVSALDYQILKQLSEDSKQSYNAIATKTKCSPATARYRIERLEKLGIIAMYRIDLNVDKMGLVFFKAQFYLKNYSAIQEEEFIAYCSRNLKVLFLLKQIGSCKLEIELEVADFEQYHELIDDLRSKFHNFIKSVETIVIRKHRYRSIPSNIFLRQ